MLPGPRHRPPDKFVVQENLLLTWELIGGYKELTGFSQPGVPGPELTVWPGKASPIAFQAFV